MTTLTDLPTDILLTIFPYLSPFDFLSFTSSTKSFLQFREDPTFWRILTRTTFRIPPQPLLQADGARWQRLYKHLRTQTRVFTWGNNEKGNLGHHPITREPTETLHPHRGHPWSQVHSGTGWPGRIQGMDQVGVVADMQCGGWSTILLDSVGVIYGIGALDGTWGQRDVTASLHALPFPLAYPPTTKDRYEPSTAIQQYSTGRSHVMGLSDSGKVWVWHFLEKEACHVKLLHVDLIENGPASGTGRVTRVVGGWDRSSIYVKDTGIIYWPHELLRRVPGGESDGVMIASETIPNTSYRDRSYNRTTSTNPESIGEVTNHIVLQGYIVFITNLNRLFFYPTIFPNTTHTSPIELITFYPNSSFHPTSSFNIQDLQGSFRSFAIFTKAGEVLTATDALLEAYDTASRSRDPPPLPQPTRIPALQNASVISLAFGDYHFHALHSNGTISSYGCEPKGCGALGLGDRTARQLRGVRSGGVLGRGDGRVDDGDGRRTIWFEQEKKLWLSSMNAKASQTNILDEIASHEYGRQALGDWFERQGSRWGEGVLHEDEMGAYFAFKVSAAGWHSGALVLADEEKAARVREKFLVRPVVEDEEEQEEDEEEKSVPPTPHNENAGGEEAEGEEVPAPWDQLAAAISDIFAWAWWAGRWFLGLTERDARREREGSRVTGEEDGGGAVLDEGDAERREVEVVWTWAEEEFPGLRELGLLW